MEIWNKLFIQLGAVGLMLSGLSLFAKKKDKEKTVLEVEFRDYLKDAVQQQFTLMDKFTQALDRNTQVYERLIDKLNK